MPVENKITKSGGGTGYHRDFTVVFQTSRIADEEISTIRQEAQLLLERRSIGNGVNRSVNLFVKNGKTLVLLHYENVTGERDERQVENDYQSLIEHLSVVLEIFDTKAN